MSLFKFLRGKLAKEPAERALWTTIYVGDYETAPTWAYTMGFQGAPGQAELIVFDMPKSSAQNLFSHVYTELQAGRIVIADGAELPGGQARCVWRRVHPDQIFEWLTMAWAIYLTKLADGADFEAYQLVLGDTQGRMPWEEGYDESLRHLQRPLWLPPEESAEAP